MGGGRDLKLERPSLKHSSLNPIQLLAPSKFSLRQVTWTCSSQPNLCVRLLETWAAGWVHGMPETPT